MFIDSHAHIYSKEFKDDIDAVVARAIEQDVRKIYMPNIDHTSINDMLELELKFPGHCIPMMGLHPCSVRKRFEKELYIVEEWLNKRKFCGVGEIGIDLYRDKTFQAYQEEAFKIQIGFAKKYNLPIVIHCRNSFDEIIAILEILAGDGSQQNRDQHAHPLQGVFHCFTGTLEEAQKVIEMGFFLGIGGIVTFKNSDLEKVIPEIDLKHIILETDSPYLAPVPHRGKRNEPAWIPLIAEKVAELKGKTVEEVKKITSENILRIYK
ncbi:MAG: TatD family deoxyribonuclease [Cytophagales bacterium]|nr:TatD family deoxyribonuclease [Cytophagales bacterium]